VEANIVINQVEEEDSVGYVDVEIMELDDEEKNTMPKTTIPKYV